MHWGFIVAGLVMAASCGGTSTTISQSKDASVDSTSACTPGQSVPCAGPGGCLGGQACNAAGTGYLACDCTTADASGGSSGGSSSGSGSGGSSGGSGGGSGSGSSSGMGMIDSGIDATTGGGATDSGTIERAM